MQWLAVAIKTDPKDVEIVAAELMTLGFTGLEIEDESDLIEMLGRQKKHWDYVDEGLLESMRGVCRIKLYVTDDEGGKERIREITACLSRMEETTCAGGYEVTTQVLREQDWTDEWKRWYKPMQIGSRVLIRPEWEALTEPTDRVIYVNDPGMSFGTGDHESTRLCIETLEKHITGGESILDLGCGSGILFIIGLLLGAGDATAVDIESNAAKTSGRNADLNNIDPDCYRVYSGDIIEDTDLQKRISDKKYDIITANIVADVIIAIAPFARRLLNKDGVFITSGIITERRDEVCTALKKCGFILSDIKEDNGWCCIDCRI